MPDSKQKCYNYTPQPDITPYELAMIVPVILLGGDEGCWSETAVNNLREDFRRHFSETPSGAISYWKTGPKSIGPKAIIKRLLDRLKSLSASASSVTTKINMTQADEAISLDEEWLALEAIQEAAEKRGDCDWADIKTKSCENPQCRRLVPISVNYCCRPCRLAHRDHYSNVGLHSPGCKSARQQREAAAKGAINNR